MRASKLALILSAIATAAGLVAALASAEGPGDQFVVLLAAVVMAGVYWVFFRPLLRAQSLLEHGLPAEATVLKVWDTGTTIDHDPQLGLHLVALRREGLITAEEYERKREEIVDAL